MLVAISIPIFTSQLEKSREATDAANIRSAYAVVQSAALMQDTAAEIATNNNSSTTFTTTGKAEDGDLTYTATVNLNQSQTGWQTAPLDIGGQTIASTDGIAQCVITWDQATNQTALTFS